MTEVIRTNSIPQQFRGYELKGAHWNCHTNPWVENLHKQEHSKSADLRQGSSLHQLLFIIFFKGASHYVNPLKPNLLSNLFACHKGVVLIDTLVCVSDDD